MLLNLRRTLMIVQYAAEENISDVSSKNTILATKCLDLRNSDFLRGELNSRLRERDSQKTILHRGLDVIIL